jgi:VCBS repeat-containing protein
MGKRAPRLPVASAERIRVTITDSDWRRIEKAYGQKLSLEARRDIHEKTQEFVDLAEFEQNAELVSDARDRITTIMGAASSLRSTIDSGIHDADIYACSLIKKHLWKQRDAKKQKEGDAVKKRRRKKDDPLRNISSGMRLLIFASQDALRDVASLVVSAIRTGTEAGSGTSGTVGSALTGTHGTLTLNADGSYTYVVNNNDAAVQALNTGGTLTDTFTYTVKDPGGLLTNNAQLTITINGADDAPVGVDDTGSATEAGGTLNATPGSNATGNVLTWGFSKGEAWDRWIVRLTSIAEKHGLPWRVRKDSDKQSDQSPFVELIWELQQSVPGTHRRAHSKDALAKAITEARRQKRDE